jgi:hypothetical protein
LKTHCIVLATSGKKESDLQNLSLGRIQKRVRKSGSCDWKLIKRVRAMWAVMVRFKEVNSAIEALSFTIEPKSPWKGDIESSGMRRQSDNIIQMAIESCGLRRQYASEGAAEFRPSIHALLNSPELIRGPTMTARPVRFLEI